MASILFRRMASAAGLVAVAFCLVGLDPFLTAGFGLGNTPPRVAIDRSLKGDRLPNNSAMAYAPDWRWEFGPQRRSQPGAEIPVGCDAAFSSISSPPPANVYRRCMV